MAFPTSARIVIIGGGVIGASIAHHLGAAGVDDVVLLERGALGSGSTCKAAGGVRAQFSDALNIQISARSMAAYRRFGDSHGQEIDFRSAGYLFLLSRPGDVAAFEASVALQNELGVPSRMVDIAEAKRLSPLIETDGVLAAAYSAEDGYCTPESVVLGYAASARAHGAQLITDCEVLGISTVAGEIRAVDTNRGTVATDVVICAAGAWSAAVGAMVGVDLPVAPYRRELAFTEPVADTGAVPMTIDFSAGFYFRPEGRGLLLGMSDPDEPPGFGIQRSAAWLGKLADAIRTRTPKLLDVGLTSGWAGLYEVTPDHNALIGEAAAAGRFLYATGFSGHGFMQAPAVGEIVTDLVLGREPFVAVTDLSADRFARAGRSRAELNYV